MSAGDTVLQIVPQFPGTFDGVGDYALNLARALSAHHGISTTFVVAADAPARARDEFPMISGLDPDAAPALARDHQHVILHYANYGYQARGVPIRLRKFARHLRRDLPGRWVTTFHELYASGPPWKSAFWVRPFQVGIARDLMDLSDACVVSNLPIEKAIHAHDASRRVHLLPVMSNFGEPALNPMDPRSPKRWVVCGGTALIARSLTALERFFGSIPDHFAPEHLDVVGGRANPAISASVKRLKQDRKLAVHHYPEVTVDLASEVLRQSAFGWLDYFA